MILLASELTILLTKVTLLLIDTAERVSLEDLEGIALSDGECAEDDIAIRQGQQTLRYQSEPAVDDRSHLDVGQGTKRSMTIHVEYFITKPVLFIQFNIGHKFCLSGL